AAAHEADHVGGHVDVPGHRFAVYPQRPGDGAQAVAGQPPPHDLAHLDHPHLDRACPPPWVGGSMARSAPRPGGGMFLKTGWGTVSEKPSRYWGNVSEK